MIFFVIWFAKSTRKFEDTEVVVIRSCRSKDNSTMTYGKGTKMVNGQQQKTTQNYWWKPSVDVIAMLIFCLCLHMISVTRLTRRVSLVEQELLTYPGTWVHPRFYVYALYIVVCPFVFFVLTTVLSVLLRYTDSDYPFGIFKLFLQLCSVQSFVASTLRLLRSWQSQNTLPTMVHCYASPIDRAYSILHMGRHCGGESWEPHQYPLSHLQRVILLYIWSFG